MDLYEMINRMQEIVRLQENLKVEEERLSAPIIKDMDMVGTVYGYCVDGIREMRPEVNVASALTRRKILFVLLFLFSPRTLAGGKMSGGLRSHIADAMGMDSTNVSHCHANIWFYYTIYSDFRSDVNLLFEVVTQNLRNSK